MEAYVAVAVDPKPVEAQADLSFEERLAQIRDDAETLLINAQYLQMQAGQILSDLFEVDMEAACSSATLDAVRFAVIRLEMLLSEADDLLDYLDEAAE